MRCHKCGGETRVSRSDEVARGRHQARVRICQEDPGHRFNTLEQPTGLQLRDVLVRRTGDEDLAPFDRRRLLGDIADGVLKRLDEGEVRRIAELAIFDLELKLTSVVEPLNYEERMAHREHQFAIHDATIRMAVEAQLRQHSNRMPHVLYALSTLGRRDRGSKLGFRDARDVLAWMNQAENYPDLARAETPAKMSRATDYWWPPSEPPLPSRVIKQRREREKVEAGNPAAEAERRTRIFNLGQFETSVRRALVGRANADVTTMAVTRWVLWDLVGQVDVLSSQLAVGVMSCLRRVDDIAYLRWTAIAKKMESVTDFRTEALSLVTHPSPKLRFTVRAMPRPLPHQAPASAAL